MTAVFTDNRQANIKLLVFYWVGYVLLFSFIQGFAAHDIMTAFYNELFSLPVKILFVWLVAGPLMSKWFFNKRFSIFFLLYALLLPAFAILLRLVDNYVILSYFLTNWNKQPLLSTPPFVYNLVKLQFVVTIPFCFRMFSFWTREQQRVQTIKAEKLQAELQALQSQFHPHFLFNVLNSLYAKILTRADDAGEMLLRISSLLRFSVYEVNGNTIPLDQELEYLRNYISLQQMRFDNRMEICFTVAGKTSDKAVEPFLMLPLIENAFKHCSSHGENSGWITIYVYEDKGQLSLQIENSLSTVNTLPVTERTQGVGLAHVRKRLELLYPNNYSLKIVPGDESFFVSLKLPLHVS